MKLSIRKNKNYTSIILQEISLQSFYESKNEFDKIKGNKVVKISKSAWNNFLSINTLDYKDTQDGDEIVLLGTTFTIVKSHDESYNNLPKIEYYARNNLTKEDNERKKETLWVFSNNVAISLIEQAYFNATGILLNY